MMTSSKLTAKYQATIPQPVRRALGIGRGDRIAFEVRKNQVRLRKFRRADVEYLRALEPTLSEWLSPQDDKAYRDL